MKVRQIVTTAAAILIFSATSYGQAPAKPSAADELQLQIVMLKSQLAQALASSAKCEAEGPQSVKKAQEAQADAQALVRDLDARGLMIDQASNKIVAKPVEKPKN